MSNNYNYYYMVMPFKLKNASATYQWLMDVLLSKQIRHTLEVYIDDIVVKTHEERNNYNS